MDIKWSITDRVDAKRAHMRDRGRRERASCQSAMFIVVLLPHTIYREITPYLEVVAMFLRDPLP